MAGRVSQPRMPAGRIRIGGFGGAEGLADYLRADGVTHLVDATHPFAAGMRANAAHAAEASGVPLIRLARLGWAEHPDAGSWRWVASYDDAREAAASLGRRPFVTTGRQTLAHYASWTDRDVLVRVVELLDLAVPARWTVVLDRGPYRLAGELELLRAHGVDVLLTKDSGGAYTAAKLDAARELDVPVVVVARPPSLAGTTEVTTVDEVLALLT